MPYYPVTECPVGACSSRQQRKQHRIHGYIRNYMRVSCLIFIFIYIFCVCVSHYVSAWCRYSWVELSVVEYKWKEPLVTSNVYACIHPNEEISVWKSHAPGRLRVKKIVCTGIRTKCVGQHCMEWDGWFWYRQTTVCVSYHQPILLTPSTNTPYRLQQSYSHLHICIFVCWIYPDTRDYNICETIRFANRRYMGWP